MLFLFTIDPNIFAGNINPNLMEDLDDILKYWKIFGVLVVLNPNPSESKLYTSINKCKNPTIKERWSVALLKDRMRQINTETNQEDLWDNGSNKIILNGEDKIEIVVISEANLKNFKFKLPQLPISLPFINNVCIPKQFRKLDSVAESDIYCNLALDTSLTNAQVWNTRYRRLINYSKKIYIYDRYCCENFIKARSKGLDNSGLEQFIMRIANNYPLGKKYIYIRSAVTLNDKESNQYNHFDKSQFLDLFDYKVKSIESEMTKTFKHIIKKTSIQEIDVQLVMDRDYGAIEHYRHLRFDDYNIIVIDKGLSHFEGPKVNQTTPFQYLPWRSKLSKPYEEDEDLLKQQYHKNGKNFTLIN
jgi:hypothetical protein